MARHVPASDALSVIAGYTVANDISVRDYQLRTHNSTQGKTFEETTPVGPFLVTGDEVDDALDLEVGCEIDGELVQHDRTSELVFSSAELVSYCSDIVTLKPGDLISTGTPGGVGFTRSPPRFLNPGQVVRTFIEGLGEMPKRLRAKAKLVRFKAKRCPVASACRDFSRDGTVEYHRACKTSAWLTHSACSRQDASPAVGSLSCLRCSGVPRRPPRSLLSTTRGEV